MGFFVQIKAIEELQIGVNSVIMFYIIDIPTTHISGDYL